MPDASKLEKRRKRIETRANTYPHKFAVDGSGNLALDSDKRPQVTDDPLDNQLTAIMSGNSARGIAAVSADIIQDHANKTYPISDPKVAKLAEDFLKYKRKHGTDIEKALYENMSTTDFITRLLTKRPLMFVGAHDGALLRNGKKIQGGFENIGTPNEKPPLTLRNYISYDEMEISALLGVSSPTHFINKGNRHNNGIATPDQDHQTEGIYIGQVGARFEIPGRMEYKYMIVTPDQNTKKNGYGKNAKKNPSFEHWKEYYDVKQFASYEEAKKDKNRFLEIPQAPGEPPHYLDKEIYRKYMRAKIETYLAEANKRGIEAGKEVYVHAIGLGTGVWGKNSVEQERIIIEIYKDIISENLFMHITDVDFSYFQNANKNLAVGILHKGIQLHFSNREPAEKLKGQDQNKLLVAQYAWDSNSKPGNEYYNNNLNGSGDPAAACCSEIHLLHDGNINRENVNGNNLRLVDVNQHAPIVAATMKPTPLPSTNADSSIKRAPRSKDDPVPTVTTDRPQPPWSACKFKDVKHSNNWNFGKPVTTGSVDRDITYKGEKQIVVKPASVTTLVIDKKAFIVALRIYQSANNDKKKLPTIITDSPEAAKVWKEVLENFYPHKNAAERDACIVPSKPKTSAIKPAADPDDITKTPTVTNS